MDYIQKSFVNGGIWMWSILGVMILALGLIFERFLRLYLQYDIKNAKGFMEHINKDIRANKLEQAIRACNQFPNGALPRIVKAGLVRANKGETEIHNALQEAILEVVPGIQKRTSNLQAVGNIATLLGLLGTVVGLIGAFNDLATVSADKRQEALGKNIAVAMDTTAFGLIIAIPCLFAYVFFSNKTKNMLDEIDEHSTKLENLLVYRLKGKLPEQPGGNG